MSPESGRSMSKAGELGTTCFTNLPITRVPLPFQATVSRQRAKPEKRSMRAKGRAMQVAPSTGTPPIAELGALVSAPHLKTVYGYGSPDDFDNAKWPGPREETVRT